MTITRSCFNCQHLKTWSFPSTWEDPSDEGWECGKGLDTLEEVEDPAENCRSWEFFDWDSYYRKQAEDEFKDYIANY